MPTLYTYYIILLQTIQIRQIYKTFLIPPSYYTILYYIILYHIILYFDCIAKSNNKKMSQPQPNTLQYEILLNSFKQDIQSRQCELQKLAYNLNIRSNKNAKNQMQDMLVSGNGLKKKNNTCEIVQLCRKNIQQIQQIFVNVHSYFVDLKLQFVYEFIVSLFKTMVVFFKVLSEKFVVLLKNRRNAEREANKKNTQLLLHDFKSSNFSDLQYFDIIIKSIEVDELRLAQEKRQAEKAFTLNQFQIQNMNASDAVNQLQNLRKQMDRVIINSIRINDEWANIRGLESSVQMKTLKSPQKIQSEYCQSISSHTHDIFVKKMLEISQKYYDTIRAKQKQKILKQIQDSRPVTFDKETQLNQNEFKERIDKNKDRGALLVQNEYLKKVNINLRKDVADLNEEKQKFTQIYKKLEQNTKTSTEILNKRIFQLYRLKSQNENNINKKDQTIQTLNKKLIQLQQKLQRGSKQQSSDFGDNFMSRKQLQDYPKDDEINKLANQTTRTQRTSFFYQRQFKITKQQNSHLRRCLQILLETLYDEKLIKGYPVDDVNNDLRLGQLVNRIQQISQYLIKSIKDIKNNKQHRRQMSGVRGTKNKPATKSQRFVSEKQNMQFLLEKQPTFELKSRNQLKSCFSSRNLLPRPQKSQKQQRKVNLNSSSSSSISKQVKNIAVVRIEASTQTTCTSSQQNSPTKTTAHHSNNFKSPNNSHQNSIKDMNNQFKKKAGQDRLELLKKQLINKINKGGDKDRQTRKTLRPKNVNEKEINMIQKNMSLQNSTNYLFEPPADRAPRRASRMKHFNRKDISFEQFKFTVNENKSQVIQKKVINRNKNPTQLLVPGNNGDIKTRIREQRRSTNRSLQIGGFFQQIQYPKMKQDLDSLGIQGYECSIEVKKFLQMVQSKKDKKDNYLRFFLGKLIADLKKTQGFSLIQQVLESSQKKKTNFTNQNSNNVLIARF